MVRPELCRNVYTFFRTCHKLKMVSFICDACGNTVKKTQVEKHYTTVCRGCSVLSCLDCGVNFPGDAYLAHTSCVTEAEKYQGNLYQARDKENKGEVKQKEWLKSVHETLNSTSDPKLRGLLKKLSAYSNIPRKKKKFENFCKNSVNVYDSKTLDQLWELFTGGTTATTTTTCNGDDNNTDSNETVGKKPVPDTLSSNSTTQHNGENSDSDAEPLAPKKKKKKKKKEEQQEVEVTTTGEASVIAHDNENGIVKKKKKKNTVGSEINAVLLTTEESKQKKKKKKSIETPVVVSEVAEPEKLQKKSKKLKKKKNVPSGAVDSEKLENTESKTEREIGKKSKLVEDESENGELKKLKVESDATEDEPQRGKFHWHKTIKQILKESDDQEISLKKLQKKVLNAYQVHGVDHRAATVNDSIAMFDKKLKSYPKAKIIKDRVKLIK